MSVAIGVHHELNTSFNSLLLLLVHLIKDSANDAVDSVLANGNDDFDHLHLDSGVVGVDSLMGLWVNYRVNDLLNEVSVGVNSRLLHKSLLCDFGERLLVNLFLFSLNSFSFLLFFLSDASLVLSNSFSAALAAPSLALTWAKIVLPMMATAACNHDNGDAVFLDHLNTATISTRLRAHCIHNLDAVVADAVLHICELPESDLTAVARLLVRTGLTVVFSLMLTTLLNSCLERNRVVILTCHLRSCSGLFTGLALRSSYTSSLLLGLLSDINTDFSEESVHIDSSCNRPWSHLPVRVRTFLIVAFGRCCANFSAFSTFLIFLSDLRSICPVLSRRCCNVVLLALIMALVLVVMLVHNLLLIVGSCPDLMDIKLAAGLAALGHRSLLVLLLLLLLHEVRVLRSYLYSNEKILSFCL